MISIIIPTLNEEKVIAESIAKLRTGLSLDYEIIVSDGKSTDKTVEIAQREANTVVEYTGSARQTIAQGRNDGAQQARGDILAFFDADSYVLNPQDFFSQAIELFEKNPNLVGVCPIVKVDPAKATRMDNLVFGAINLTMRLANNVLHRGGGVGECQIIRRTAFEQVQGYNEKLVASEDHDMFYRLSRIGRTMTAPHLVVYHSGRRAHKLGWWRLLPTWYLNFLSFVLFRKAASKEWKVVR